MAVLLITGPTAAHAQSTGAPVTATKEGAQPAGQPDRVSGRRSYDAAYFAPYAPATALQMVERVPGFTLEQVDPTLRGFGQTAGNVVINGQRPSSKSDTLDTILARIPASRVLRIEVAPGDLFGADYTGKAQVLNLILTAAGGLATTLEGTLKRDFSGQLLPSGSASALLRRGPSTFNVSLTTFNPQSTEEGYDRVVSLPDRQLVEYRDKVNRLAEPNGALAGSWDYNGGTNKTARLNFRVGLDHTVLTQTNLVFPVDGPDRNDRLTERYLTQSYELGGEVVRPLAGGAIKLLALGTRQYDDNKDVSLNRIDSEVIGGDTQRLQDALDETLARLTWSRIVAGWSVELGGEGVINRLRSDVDLFELAPGGTPTRIDLPVDDATVLEHRAEVFVNAGRPLTKKLRVDLGLTYETSKLTVSGDASAERALSYLKPKLVLDWHPSSWRAQLSLQRTVAQLQFTDFISSAQLSSGQVNGGNPNLVPQRSWESLLTVERPILGDGLFRVELGYNRIAQVQDRVPTPDGFDAPGNLGTGQVYIARARLEAPLKRFGIKGGRLTLYGSYVGTSVRDPYTLRLRPFSGSSAFVGEAEFRQDLGKFAYGATLDYNTPVTFYRINETDRNDGGFPYLKAFVEWRATSKMTLTLNVDNIADIPSTRTRTFYDPTRATPDPYLRELRNRNRHVQPSITLKRTFG